MSNQWLKFSICAAMALCINACADGSNDSDDHTPSTCTASRCDGNKLSLCLNGVLQAPQDCVAGTFCDVGSSSCMPTSIEHTNRCSFEGSQCDGDALKKCTNGKVAEITPCANGCSNSKCNECRAGTKDCAGNAARACENGVWTIKETCELGCNNGVCKQPEATVCDENKKQCKGDVVQICKNNEWTDGESCELGCDAQKGECREAPAGEACKNKGSLKCDGKDVYECDGSVFVKKETCSIGCTNGQCNADPNACTAAEKNKTKCDAASLLTCDGSKWNSSKCDFGCDANTGKCNADPNACTAAEKNKTKCDGNFVSTCDGAKWNKAQTACEKGCDAQKGDCKPICNENATQCSGNYVETCKNNAWSKAQTACTNGCDPNVGVCNTAPITCSDNDKRCSGKVVQTCQSNKWVDAGAACEKGCKDGACIEPKPYKEGDSCDFKTFPELCQGENAVYCDDNNTIKFEDCSTSASDGYKCDALVDYYGAGINYAACFSTKEACTKAGAQQNACHSYTDGTSKSGTEQCYHSVNGNKYWNWSSEPTQCKDSSGKATQCADETKCEGTSSSGGGTCKFYDCTSKYQSQCGAGYDAALCDKEYYYCVNRAAAGDSKCSAGAKAYTYETEEGGTKTACFKVGDDESCLGGSDDTGGNTVTANSACTAAQVDYAACCENGNSICTCKSVSGSYKWQTTADDACTNGFCDTFTEDSNSYIACFVSNSACSSSSVNQFFNTQCMASSGQNVFGGYWCMKTDSNKYGLMFDGAYNGMCTMDKQSAYQCNASSGDPTKVACASCKESKNSTTGVTTVSCTN